MPVVTNAIVPTFSSNAFPKPLNLQSHHLPIPYPDYPTRLLLYQHPRLVPKPQRVLRQFRPVVGRLACELALVGPRHKWIGVVGVVGASTASCRPIGVLYERPIRGDASGENADAEFGGGEKGGLDVVPYLE